MNLPIKKANQKSCSIKKLDNKNFKKSNLGMNLEKMINNSNNFYTKNNIAVIYKKPTPIQVVKVNYKSRSTAVITEAYYKTPSTTDYNGIYKGKYIDFEAKETKSKTSFPLSNIHMHQIVHLKRIMDQGGIAFLIVSFNLLNEIFLVPFLDLYEKYYLIQERKSIPYSYFKNSCFIIPFGLNPELKYLEIIDKIYLEK